ncbi:MAG: hypothetical protein WC637_04660 [Victivallales bacterium]|jgi:hypothetical protein
MIRKYLGLMLLLCCGIAVNAAKIALIPTAPELAPMADQVLAAMSNEPGIEFLERASIETVLSERKLTAAGLTSSNLSELGKLIHADLFAIITAKPGKKGAAVSGLIVYDARNGFRMVNATLPEEDTVKDITKYLRQSQDIIGHPEKQILLSVATVRDAGVPERFKYLQAFIAADLERRLGGIPNVTVLERDFLDSVNQERKTTEQMFELAPSSRLLRLEFAPGSSPEIVNLTLRVTDAANKELFRFNLDNCLTDTEATAMKTISAVAEYLKVSPPNIKVSASYEAARFFAEYQFFSRLGDYAAARRKLEASIALEPKKLEYRLAVLSLNREGKLTFHNKVLMLIQNLMLADEIRRDFPGSKPYSERSYEYLDLSRLCEATPEDMLLLKQWAEKYSPMYDEIMRKIYKFDLREGINSLAELRAYQSYCCFQYRYDNYFDNDKWYNQIHKGVLENLRVSKAFYEKHPELCSRPEPTSEVHAWLFSGLSEAGTIYRSSRSRFGIKTAAEKLLVDSSECIAEAKTHPHPQVKVAALFLDLLRETVISRYDKDIFKKNVLEYYGQAYAIKKNLEIDIFIPEFFTDYDILTGIARKSKNDFIEKEVKLPPMEALFFAVTKNKTESERAQKVIELANELLKYKAEAFTNPLARDFFYIALGVKLKSSSNPECRQAITLMNRDVSITKLESPETAFLKKANIRNAVWQNGNIYLLCEYDSMLSKGLSIERLNPAREKLSELASCSTKFQFTASVGHDLPPFAVSEKFALAAGDHTVYAFSLPDGKITEINDLPSDKVMAVSILNDRFYVFAGMENKGGGVFARETILFSCKPDGSDRQIHISTSRDNKQNNMDREKPFTVHSISADPARNRLILNCSSSSMSGNVRGLWEFIPSENTGKCLLKLDYPLDSVTTTIDNEIYLSFFHRDFYIYDMKTDQKEMVFSTEKPAARHYLKIKSEIPTVHGGLVYWPPFFIRSGQIWFGGNCNVKLLTLPDISKSPLVLFPEGRLPPSWDRLIFPHPDGKSAIVIDEKNIYKITPRETGEK